MKNYVDKQRVKEVVTAYIDLHMINKNKTLEIIKQGILKELDLYD